MNLRTIVIAIVLLSALLIGCADNASNQPTSPIKEYQLEVSCHTVNAENFNFTMFIKSPEDNPLPYFRSNETQCSVTSFKDTN